MSLRTAVRELVDRLGIAGELLRFFWEQRLWFLLPLVLLIIFAGLVIIGAQGSALAPFIYTLF